MKAAVIEQGAKSGRLEIREVSDPVPGPCEVLVRVHATALNRADILQRRGLYPAPPGVRDDIPGLEFSGKIKAVGSDIEKLRIADPVMGLLPGEGYAELVATHQDMVIPVPASLNLEEAAAIPEAFITAFDALFNQLELKEKETVLIHAVASGVGTAALQLAKASGAFVFGTCGTQDKLVRSKDLGLDHGINYKVQDFQQVVKKETHDQGVQAVLDVVGSPYWRRNMESLAPQGRMVLLGFLGGSKVETDLSLILRKRLKIMGTVLRSRSLEEKIALTGQFRRHVLPLLESGQIKPVIDRVFPLQEAAQAHTYMEGNHNFGKIVLRVSG